MEMAQKTQVTGDEVAKRLKGYIAALERQLVRYEQDEVHIRAANDSQFYGSKEEILQRTIDASISTQIEIDRLNALFSEKITLDNVSNLVCRECSKRAEFEPITPSLDCECSVWFVAEFGGDWFSEDGEPLELFFRVEDVADWEKLS